MAWLTLHYLLFHKAFHFRANVRRFAVHIPATTLIILKNVEKGRYALKMVVFLKSPLKFGLELSSDLNGGLRLFLFEIHT